MKQFILTITYQTQCWGTMTGKQALQALPQCLQWEKTCIFLFRNSGIFLCNGSHLSAKFIDSYTRIFWLYVEIKRQSWWNVCFQYVFHFSLDVVLHHIANISYVYTLLTNSTLCGIMFIHLDGMSFPSSACSTRLLSSIILYKAVFHIILCSVSGWL